MFAEIKNPRHRIWQAEWQGASQYETRNGDAIKVQSERTVRSKCADKQR